MNPSRLNPSRISPSQVQPHDSGHMDVSRVVLLGAKHLKKGVMSRSPIFRPLSALGRSPPIRFRSEAVRIWCGLGPLASVLRRASSVLFGLLSYCSLSLPFLLLYSARFLSLVMLRRARTSSYHRHALVVVYKDPLVAPWEATVLRPLVSRRVPFLSSHVCE